MASLARDDPDPQARARAVAEARRAYRFDHDYLPPLPMLHIPELSGHKGILEFLAGSFLGVPEAERPDDDMPTRRFRATAAGLGALGIERVLRRRRDRFPDPDGYLQLVRALPDPPHLTGNARYEDTWTSDRAFAWQRLAGPNPVVIERPDAARWSALQPRQGLTDAHLRAALGDGAPTVQQALAAERLFVCDYAILEQPEPVPCGTWFDEQKYLPAPIAVFVHDDAREELIPAAIRLGQRPDAAFAVRDGSERWQVAKAMVATADFNHHEMGVHLSLTHFVQEGIAVALRRSLPPLHPVATLLLPHFKYLLFNNFAGRELLVQPKGFVSTILAGDLQRGSLELVRRFYEQFSFDDLDLPARMVGRGVMSRTGLTVYPYRDDALLLWPAIDTWVRSYLAAYYASDGDVRADAELQAWAREMTAADGARMKGFPEAFDTLDRLATAVTRIVFLAGPHHAAVNYAQLRSMMVIPNMTGAAWSPAADRLIDLLPPIGVACTQAEIIWTLTCYQYGRLGYYGAALTDPRVLEPLARFQTHLEQAESTITARNRTERAREPYLYLAPSRVPNSTNI